MAKRKFDPTVIQVHFKAGIRPDGELETVCIRQADQEIRLTEKQALSLTRQFAGRFVGRY